MGGWDYANFAAVRCYVWDFWRGFARARAEFFLRNRYLTQRFAAAALLCMTDDRWFNAHHNAQHLALYPSKMVTKS